MKYGFKKVVKLDFEDAVGKVKTELKEQGFGVLTEIDVKKTLKEKLNVDYDNYVILGACNPPFAYNALQKEKDIGLLLPCNVIVYVKDEKTYVSAIDPIKAMSIIDNPELEEIAKQVGKKLKNVVEKI